MTTVVTKNRITFTALVQLATDFYYEMETLFFGDSNTWYHIGDYYTDEVGNIRRFSHEHGPCTGDPVVGLWKGRKAIYTENASLPC